MAKAKAAPHDPEAEAWQQMLAKERAEQEAKEKALTAPGPLALDPKARAAADERRWKEAHNNHMASYDEATKTHAQMSEEQARLARIQRSKEEAAKRATAGLGNNAPVSSSGFSWKKQAPASAGGYQSGLVGRGNATAKTLPSLAAVADLPGHDDCELAVSAMISRTVQGMREGLRQLGLPDFPLNFIPGRELVLCGHDMREIINEMIHAWMVEEKDEFYNVLLRIKQIVEKPILNEEEVALVQQKEEWEKLRTPEGQAMYMQKTAEAAALGPLAKAKPVVSSAGDSDDEVIDVSDKPPQSAALNFAKATPPVSTDDTHDEDYYALLGVSSTATLQEIRMKFRQLVVTEHPEKGGDAKKFALLNRAYGVLSDQSKRRDYDEQRSA